MSFVREDEEDESKPGEANTQLSSAGGQVITGQGAPAAPTSSNPQSSGRFQNLQNYMNVNREQAGEFGGQIAGTLTQGVDDAKTTLNTEVDQFGNEVDGGTIKFDPSLAGKSAQEIAADEKLAETYRTGKGGTYAGPQDFTSNQGITNLNQAGERVQNTGTFSGMQSTVKDVLTPQAQNYSRGEQTLDSVFLTRPEENRTRFSGLRDAVSKEVPQAVETAQTRASDLVKAGVEASTAAGGLYKGDFDGRTQGIQGQIDADVIKQNEARRQQYEAEKARLTQQGNGLDEWGQFGYEQQNEFNSPFPGISGQKVGFNPLDYLKYGGDVQGSNVLTDPQIAEMKALEQLSSPEYWSNPYATGRQEAAAASTFNDSGFQQAQQQHNQVGQQFKEQFNNQVNPIIAQMNAALESANRGGQEEAPRSLDGDIYQRDGSQQPNERESDAQIAERFRSQPVPLNPMGFKTVGEYLDSL